MKPHVEWVNADRFNRFRWLLSGIESDVRRGYVGLLVFTIGFLVREQTSAACFGPCVNPMSDKPIKSPLARDPSQSAREPRSWEIPCVNADRLLACETHF
jgi:hypothetical protein